jgi:predicted tellurium resistance membrane protein TerC
MLEPLMSGEGLVSLVTLTLLEVVLGIDNVIFISILSAKLPENKQGKARSIGIILALVMRVALLFAITWIIGLKKPLFTVFDMEFSWRDLILFSGGLFLLYKSTMEIHTRLEGEEETGKVIKTQLTLASAIVQIVLLDIVFSFDSILTAIGLVDEIIIMIIAVIISLGVMLLFAKTISDFVNRHPTIKMLALSFLLMIGLLLVVEAFEVHVPKGYVYFAMAFSLFVEMLNLRMHKKRNPVKLRNPVIEPHTKVTEKIKEDNN